MSGVENNGAVVAGRYAGALLEFLRTLGIDPKKLFPATQIAVIESDGAAGRLTVTEFLRMLQLSVAATGDPDLGFKVGLNVRPRHLGVVGRILMCCADVGEALTQYDRYVRLVHGLTRPLALRRGTQVEMPLDWPQDSVPPPALAQLVMASRVGMVRMLTGKASATCDTDFQFNRPRIAAQYEKFFGGRVRFGQKQTRLRFPAAYLKLPILMADAELGIATRAQAEAQLRESEGESEFLCAIKNTLAQGMAAGRTGVVDTARAMGVSTRTLHRRLLEQGCAFRVVLDRVRRERAEHDLGRPQATLAEVAFMLGYTEQSAFQHAFKRWTGLTPGQYRQRALDQ
ncbi:MAG: AraC family transcriptional regulator [Stenotrophobium sp.]